MDQQMSPWEFYERGLVLKQVHMFHPAIDDFQAAARDSQYEGKAYAQMAMCLDAIGHDEEAIIAFRRAIASPTVSFKEQCQILYQLGRTLESLGRDAEGLEVYGRISKTYPDFLDVAQRMKSLSLRQGRRSSRIFDWWGDWVHRVRARRRARPPHLLTALDQIGQ